MILNVSGRTDIIAFYSEWFKNRYKAGFIDVRNPFNPHQVSRIRFTDVDAIVFCTKNPAPIIDFLPEITQPIIFHITLTSYLSDIEPFVPKKTEVIKNIKQISQLIGPDCTYVRYDPILLNDYYTIEYHLAAFDKLAAELTGAMKHFIVSFVDIYKNVERNLPFLKLRDFTEDDYQRLGEGFSKSAKQNGQTVQTCFEEHNLAEYGFIEGECMSHEMARELTGKDFPEWTARKERKCHCVQMIDIGAYNSCGHRCKYCYANFDEDMICGNMLAHNPKSSLLLGELSDEDIITIRKDNALKKKLATPGRQTSLLK